MKSARCKKCHEGGLEPISTRDYFYGLKKTNFTDLQLVYSVLARF